ncbi:MAG: hypothetical protein OSJ43_06385 [Oscillospiraceae bacterium]|nr:hypothetical protein [Oscillospiraceae bacterium]
MSLNFFKSSYTIRRFSDRDAEIIDGYSHTFYEDIEGVILNVQPDGQDSVQANGEGERRSRKLKTYGDFHLTSSDQATGRRGDWLLYNGSWYECISAVVWTHTPLAHCRGEFVEIPASEINSTLMEEAKEAEDSNEWSDGCDFF